ncbi:MAG TPA: hypothetical protein P5548_01685 [Candidatus Moranbacteria bacterium]|nr:hypothetical protein [Candidatus Moranbacteria bacterium]HRZ33593.1 hypothetical protein [Candidatus Moranbacteria bacterium]
MKRKKIIIAISFLSSLFLGRAVHGVEMKYNLLQGIPGFYAAGETVDNFPDLILAIYKFGIWTVGIAGLFMITIGGFWYMTSAGNTARAETAKQLIADSLLGIVAAMSAYLILYIINPDLTKVDLSIIQRTFQSGE